MKHRNFALPLLVLLVAGVTWGQEEKVTIAVVGGTTFGYPPDFGKGLVEEEGSFTVETNAGESPPIYRMRYEGVPFYYVRMHGQEARPAGRAEGWRASGGREQAQQFVRTWAALHELGVTHAFGGATSGGINPAYDFDDLVVVDDFLVLGNQRPQSILHAAGIERSGVFASFAVPYCPDLRRLILERAEKSYPGRVHPRGVVVQDDPVRWETPAEIRMMRTLGGDVVTHNVVTESIYARQLGIHFALMMTVSNPATGVRPYTFEDMQDSTARIAAASVPLILEVIRRVPELEHTCGTGCVGEPFRGSYTKKEPGS